MRTGAKRFLDLATRYGREAVLDAIIAIMDRSEAMARRHVASIPDGEYVAESYMDDDGVEIGKRVPIRVKVTVKGDEMTIDLSDVARQVRGAFLALREREFVEAARCLGATPARIVLKLLLPNAVGPIIVAATLGISGAILTESSLSYLGLGIQPPVASWGNMLRNAQDQMTRAPWTAVFPGLMIFLTVLAVNYVGDGLRDALDPRNR